jgi:hypothetical protein
MIDDLRALCRDCEEALRRLGQRAEDRNANGTSLGRKLSCCNKFRIPGDFGPLPPRSAEDAEGAEKCHAMVAPGIRLATFKAARLCHKNTYAKASAIRPTRRGTFCAGAQFKRQRSWWQSNHDILPPLVAAGPEAFRRGCQSWPPDRWPLVDCPRALRGEYLRLLHEVHSCVDLPLHAPGSGEFLGRVWLCRLDRPTGTRGPWRTCGAGG